MALIYVTADTVSEPEEVTCCVGGGVTLPAFGGVQQHQPNGQWGQRELGASLGPPPRHALTHTSPLACSGLRGYISPALPM